MQSAAEYNIPVIILDWPKSTWGMIVDGNVLDIISFLYMDFFQYRIFME
jgi:uncharacterized protein YbbC (DUF1343 family)